MKRGKRVLLALPFVLGAALWPVAQSSRQRARAQTATLKLFDVLQDTQKTSEQFVPNSPSGIEQLLAQGANINAKNSKGETPLRMAFLAQRPEAVRFVLIRFILEKGANINAQDAKGETPLMWAVSMQNPELVRLLLKKGASVNIRDHDNWTALDIIKQQTDHPYYDARPSKQQLADENKILALLHAAKAET